MAEWSRQFQRLVGGLPVDYMVFDLETTGFSRQRDLPLDIGFVIVRDRQIAYQGNFVLDWTRYKGVDQRWLAYRLEDCGYRVRAKGVNWVYTRNYLRKHGCNPLESLSEFHDLLWVNRDAGAHLVAHNGWSFDLAMLHNLFAECSGTFRCRDDELYDTGGMEKAMQLKELPQAGDTLRGFFSRVISRRVAGLTWNVAACVQRWGLMTPDAPFTEDQFHTASADCWFTHRLFEKHRELGGTYADDPGTSQET